MTRSLSNVYLNRRAQQECEKATEAARQGLQNKSYAMSSPECGVPPKQVAKSKRPGINKLDKELREQFFKTFESKTV